MTDTTKRILIVLTSHDKLGFTGEKTGFWIEEFAAPYYVFKDAGFNITLASVDGGQPPVDPKSELDDFKTDDTRRFDADKETQLLLANTSKLETLNSSDFDAVFYPGGHGPLWDLTNNEQSISLIESFIAQNKPVGAVCHATAVLLHAKNSTGDLLIKGKDVTGFSNSEEAAVELTGVVPFLLEDELKNSGANYLSGDDWHPFAIQDGLLFSGQNPASSSLVANDIVSYMA